MTMLNTLAQIATKPVRRTVSPKTHSMVDLIMVGTFLAGAGLFWRRNKRAALGALICGSTDLAVIDGLPGAE